MLQKPENITKELFLEHVKKLQLRFPVVTISEETGFSKANVSRYLSGKQMPSVNFLKAFYKWLSESNIDVTAEKTPDVIVTQGNTVYLIELKEQIKELKDDKVFIKKQFEEELKNIKISLEKVLSNQDEITMQLRAVLSYASDQVAANDPHKKAKEKEHVDKLISAGRK